MENSAQNPHFRLSVSVVLYNSSLALLQRVLHSVQSASLAARADARVDSVLVVLIDNSSIGESRSAVEKAVRDWPQDDFFELSYHGMSENHGFGAGHNTVLAFLDSDFHLILNPDAELAEDALLVGLATLQEDSSIVLVSPRVSDDSGRQEFLCKRYPSVLVLVLRAFAPRFLRRVFRKRLYRYEMRDSCVQERESEVLLASGCYMLVRTAALRSVGGFDDDYFLYFEDFDLSLRIGGHGRLVFNPDMHIVHHGGYAARKGFRHVRYFIRSGITFFNQHGWRWI
tara:strand:- start:269277 stop:270128 length:852 start_codon:yes stop_codon:yes gene_type:complete